MVNVQEYVEKNFPKHAREIIAIRKNLGGNLDLSEYPNLHKVDIGCNPQLRYLRLARSNQITFISIYGTGINDFSFLGNMPNIQAICLPRAGDKIGDVPGNVYIAQIIREINREKDQRIKELQSQLNKEQTNNQNLQQQNDQFTSQLQQKNQELGKKDQRIKELQSQLNKEQTNNQNLQQQNDQFTSQLQQKNQELEKLSKENQQFQQLSDLLYPNQPYNFTELKTEVTRLKIQELTPQVRSKETELKQLITNVKTKGGEKIVNLLLETKQQIEQTNDNSLKDKLSGKIEAYQSILEDSLTQEEIKALLNKQTELLQLEKQLDSLQVTNSSFSPNK